MPKIGEMIESKYLKQADIDDEAEVTVVGVKKANIAKEHEEPEYKWLIKFGEFSKPMVLNTTNIQLLAKACASEDTDQWKGKKVLLYVDENVSFGGKLTGGLRIRSMRKVAADDTTKALVDMDDDVPF